MAIIFEPLDLKKSVDEMIEFFDKYQIEYWFDASEEYNPEKNAEEYNDDEVVVYNKETRLGIGLPRSDSDLTTTIDETCCMIQEAKDSRLIDNYMLVSTKSALIRINTLQMNYSSIWDMNINTDIKLSNRNYTIEIESGLTSFNFYLTMKEMYSKYFPPIDEYDTFIRIECDENIVEEDLFRIFNAYFFEIKSTFGIEIQVDPWNYEYVEWDEEDEAAKEGVVLRPLLHGAGINELIEIYKSAFNTEYPEQRILSFSRVIEYVSQTVIRKDLIEKTKVKLSSARALTPDGNYILELGKIFDDHRILNKDFEAFKITIETCCDVYELKNFAPDFLNKITLNSKVEEKQKALEEIASSISSTRNMHAHAKTNYKKRGDECPSTHIHEFANMLDIISQQLIRWFSIQQEESRII